VDCFIFAAPANDDFVGRVTFKLDGCGVVLYSFFMTVRSAAVRETVMERSVGD